MLLEHIQGAMSKARCETIEDKEPFYGEIVALKGVWATGKTLAECRKHLEETLEGWIIVRLRKGLDIPKVNGKALKPATRLAHA